MTEWKIYGPRRTSGYTLNQANTSLTAYRDAAPSRPSSAHKQLRMYQQNPITAENGGEGPSRWSTTNSTLGFPHPDKPSIYHFRRPASAPAQRSQKVLPYELGSGPTLNNRYVPPTAGGPAAPRGAEVVFDYGRNVDRKVQRRVENRLKRADPLGYRQHVNPGTEYNTSTNSLFMRHTAASRAKAEKLALPLPRTEEFSGASASPPPRPMSGESGAPSLTAGFGAPQATLLDAVRLW